MEMLEGYLKCIMPIEEVMRAMSNSKQGFQVPDCTTDCSLQAARTQLCCGSCICLPSRGHMHITCYLMPALPCAEEGFRDTKIKQQAKLKFLACVLLDNHQNC